MLLLIAVLTFGAVALSVMYLTQPRTDAVRTRILEGSTPNDLPRRRTVSGGAIPRLIAPLIIKCGSLLSGLLPHHWVFHIDRLLIHAGQPMSLGAFLTISLLVTTGTALLAFWMITTLTWDALAVLPLAALVVVYGSSIPYLLLRRSAAVRTRNVNRALPDALDLLVSAVEAGLGVDAAFAVVAQRTKGPLAVLLNEYLRQVGLGQGRSEALQGIAGQTGAEGLSQLAAMVAQSSVVGTGMGDVLRVQANEMRAVRRLRAQAAASRAAIWMTLPLALCFLPAMAAVIVVPSILNLLDGIREIGLG